MHSDFMETALRVQEKMALEKFESLKMNDKHRVLLVLDELAKARGYANEKEMKKKKPHIWNQLLAQVMSEKFPGL